MPKVGMEPIRRRQLIDATLEAIHEDGIADATIARISRRAGLSSGIVHHYFTCKEDLLFATLRKLLSDIRRAVGVRLAEADSPQARLDAIIDGNFASEQFTPQAVSAWLAFWAQVPHAPNLERLQRINSRRSLSNIRYALRQLVADDDVEATAMALSALIDGLWVRCATGEGLDGASARRIARDFVANIPQRRRPPRSNGQGPLT